MEEGELSADAVEGDCRFDCDACRCSCQCTFVENKRHTIANGLKKNGMKYKPTETRKSQREGGCSLFFYYVRNSLDNYSVREFQDVDSRSEFEVVTDIATKTAINISTHTAMQCNPNVMRGLQDHSRSPDEYRDEDSGWGWWEEGEYFHSAGKEGAQGAWYCEEESP